MVRVPQKQQQYYVGLEPHTVLSDGASATPTTSVGLMDMAANLT
jgi:hypothetical protein